MQTAQTAATARGPHTPAEPITLWKRIGSTLHRVNLHFSENTAETIDDKIL